MDDVIYREDALERLRSIPADLGRRELDDSIKAIENMPSAQQWIPCSERLPDKEGEYLVTFNDKWHGPRVRALWYGTPFDIIIDRDKWVFYCDHEYGFETFAPRKPIVAWMPLPEPYRGKTNERSNQGDEVI